MVLQGPKIEMDAFAANRNKLPDLRIQIGLSMKAEITGYANL